MLLLSVLSISIRSGTQPRSPWKRRVRVFLTGAGTRDGVTFVADSEEVVFRVFAEGLDKCARGGSEPRVAVSDLPFSSALGLALSCLICKNSFSSFSVSVEASAVWRLSIGCVLLELFFLPGFAEPLVPVERRVGLAILWMNWSHFAVH